MMIVSKFRNLSYYNPINNIYQNIRKINLNKIKRHGHIEIERQHIPRPNPKLYFDRLDKTVQILP